jgi:hypothetical protein
MATHGGTGQAADVGRCGASSRAGFWPTGWRVSPEWPVRRVGGA